jgi:hypothetical protein
MPAMPAPMTAKCLKLDFAMDFGADFEEDAEGREGREEDDEAAEGWLLDIVALGLKSEVLVLRLRFICRSPKIIVEPTVCTVMAPS